VIIGDEHLITAIEGGFDRLGVLDIDAEHVGDEASDEGVFFLTLAEDGFDAFADAFAFGFQVLKESLAGDEAGALFAGGAELLGDLGDLLAEGGSLVGAFFELALEGLDFLGDGGEVLV
jgi:hypothetical protein